MFWQPAMRNMSRPSALRDIPQSLAGCNLRTAARPPRAPSSQGCVALRSVLRLYVASVGTWLVPTLTLDMPCHDLLQLSSGMKVFACVASQNAPRYLRKSLACGMHTSQLNEWPGLFLFSSLLFLFGSGYCAVLFSPPGGFDAVGTRPEASPYRARGELQGGGTGPLPRR